MTIEEIRGELALGDLEEPFIRGWEESDRLFDESELEFLRDAFIRENAALVALDGEAVDRLVEVSTRALRNPALCRLLWHEHRIYTGRQIPEQVTATRRTEPTPGIPFLDQEYDPSGFPDLAAAIGEDAPALNLLIALSAVPHALAFYVQRRIPLSVLRDTLSDFGIWYRYYREQLGQAGINAGTLSWLRFHLQGRLFRLGRLQFMRGSFPRDLTVYCSRRTGEARALAAAGLSVDGEGLLVFGPDDVPDHERGKTWVTQRTRTAETVTGHPIDPKGWIDRPQVELPFDEYRPVLHGGTPVLEVHIPEGGPITVEACSDSFSRVMEFFPSYFPERGFECFTCESWFLGREIQGLFDEDSNIARFARELYLYPCLGGEEETLGRIFGPKHGEIGLQRWPRRTRLQRAVAAHIESGGRLREGGGFILTEDLPWGRRAYRRTD